MPADRCFGTLTDSKNLCHVGGSAHICGDSWKVSASRPNAAAGSHSGFPANVGSLSSADWGSGDTADRSKGHVSQSHSSGKKTPVTVAANLRKLRKRRKTTLCLF